MKYFLFFICALLLASCTIARRYQDTNIVEPTVTVIASEPTAAGTTEQPYPLPDDTEPTSQSPKPLDVQSGTILQKFTDGRSGAYFDYYTFVPDHAVENMPLIVFLHGDGEIGRINALQNIALIENSKEYYGNEFPFIAIAPCRYQKSWSIGASPDTLIALIEETSNRYIIDPNRIIITGFSSGAMGVWYMISNYSEYFSAAVPISCPNEYPIIYENIKNTPIWCFVGEKEEYYTRKMGEIVDYTTETGGNAKLTVIENMPHEGMDKAAFSRELIDWMLAQ